MLFEAQDLILKRRVSLRVNFYTDEPTRAWFLREAEALGRLDHPAIRHVYDAASSATSRTGWGTGSRARGSRRRSSAGPAADPHGAHPGPRPPQRARACPRPGHHRPAHRAGLGAVELRRAAAPSPTCGSAATPCPPFRPAPIRTGLAFMAPEVRDGGPGGCHQRRVHRRRPALLRHHRPGAATGPAARSGRPTELRPAVPPGGRAASSCGRCSRRQDDRYLTAAEMLEDFASDAGTFETPAVAVGQGALPRPRTRRALGEAAAAGPGR